METLFFKIISKTKSNLLKPIDFLKLTNEVLTNMKWKVLLEKWKMLIKWTESEYDGHNQTKHFLTIIKMEPPYWTVWSALKGFFALKNPIGTIHEIARLIKK